MISRNTNLNKKYKSFKIILNQQTLKQLQYVHVIPIQVRVSSLRGTPELSHPNGIFRYKPSIFGVATIFGNPQVLFAAEPPAIPTGLPRQSTAQPGRTPAACAGKSALFWINESSMGGSKNWGHPKMDGL